MRDVSSLLKDADPVQREPGLSGADAARLRNVILGSAREPRTDARFWPSALAVAAAVVLMVITGTFAGGRLSSPGRNAPAQGGLVRETGERRQVQFATPGGTRIIWTLDPEFTLGEVVP